MSVGSVAETVTVVGEQQLLDTGQAMVALRVTTEQIRELPLVGRDFLDLALMGAGVTEVATGAPAGATARPSAAAYSRYTAYQLDGFGNTRDQHGVQKADVSLDAISEFSVLTNQFSAEYGTVDVGDRLGHHQERHQPLQRQRLPLRAARLVGRARSAHRTPGAIHDRQDAGFTFGGPIVKDRTHFFSNLEYRERRPEGRSSPRTLGDGSFQGTFPIGSQRLRLLSKVDHRFNENNQVDARRSSTATRRADGIGSNTVGENPQVEHATTTGRSRPRYTLLISIARSTSSSSAYSNGEHSSERPATTLTPTGVGSELSGTGHHRCDALQTAPTRAPDR